MISSRRPEKLYGWLWSVAGLGLPLAFLANGYAVYSVANPGALPAPQRVVWALEMGWVVSIVVLPFLLLLFPDGRLPSRRWRFLAWAILVVGGIVLVLGPFYPDETTEPVGDPFAASGAVGRAIFAIADAGIVILFLATFISALSLVIRYRRARGLERQQIKWFVYAALLLASGLPMDLLGLDSLLGATLWTLYSSITLIGLCLAVGIAIFRYRLYDIDVIVNRTLVYGALTVSLVLVYFGGVVSLQYVLGTLAGGGSQLAIVASTLAIAALFNPVRRSFQAFIDRVFYRRKYDAVKTLEAFGARLRDETDLETLGDDLVAVTRETMEPAHVSLWLRTPGEPR
jgi:hypothetical protein